MKVAAAALPLWDYVPCAGKVDIQSSDVVFLNLGGSQYQTPFKQREEWLTSNHVPHPSRCTFFPRIFDLERFNLDASILGLSE